MSNGFRCCLPFLSLTYSEAMNRYMLRFLFFIASSVSVSAVFCFRRYSSRYQQFSASAGTLLCAADLFLHDWFEGFYPPHIFCRSHRPPRSLLDSISLSSLCWKRGRNLATFQSTCSLSGGIAILFIAICSVECILHSYQDKVQTRIMLRVLIITGIGTLACMLLLPSHFNTYFLMTLVVGSVMGGHLLALTFNRFTRIFLWVSLGIWTCVCIMNLWMHLFNF